jgi:hypothetical protein
MVYRGRIQGGVVVLEGAEMLPDGLEVTITPVVQVSQSAMSACKEHLAERVDRLLSRVHETTAEGIEAQQRVDRVL